MTGSYGEDCSFKEKPKQQNRSNSNNTYYKGSSHKQVNSKDYESGSEDGRVEVGSNANQSFSSSKIDKDSARKGSKNRYEEMQ
jgi:hypothetical protein